MISAAVSLAVILLSQRLQRSTAAGQDDRQMKLDARHPLRVYVSKVCLRLKELENHLRHGPCADLLYVENPAEIPRIGTAWYCGFGCYLVSTPACSTGCSETDFSWRRGAGQSPDRPAPYRAANKNINI